MLLKIRREDAAKWAQEAQLANTTYFRIRRELYQRLVEDTARAADAAPAACITLSYEVFIVFKQYLTARNETITDDKRLAFDRAVGELGMASALPVPGLGRYLGFR